MADLFKGVVSLSQAEYKQMLDEGRVGDVVYDRNYLYITPELADLAGTTVHIGDNIVEDLLFIRDPQEQLNDKVSLTEAQTITGAKTFTENIYLANADGTVDRISHINNNFIIYSGANSGTALLNIDEGLQKIYAFNNELAFKSDLAETGGTTVKVGGVAVSDLSFDSDPQTQINLLSTDFENKVSKSGDTVTGALILESGAVFGNNEINSSNSGNTFEISHDEDGSAKNIFNYTHGAIFTLNNTETPLVLQGMTDRPSYVSGAGVNSDLALKSDIDTAIDGLGTVFDLKGSKNTIGELPTTGNTVGDVWYVVSEEVGYIWLNDGTSERWERFGAPIDLSGYAEKSELNNYLSLSGGTMTGNISNGSGTVFGFTENYNYVGNESKTTLIRGSDVRPKYYDGTNTTALALQSDIPIIDTDQLASSDLSNVSTDKIKEKAFSIGRTVYSGHTESQALNINDSYFTTYKFIILTFRATAYIPYGTSELPEFSVVIPSSVLYNTTSVYKLMIPVHFDSASNPTMYGRFYKSRTYTGSADYSFNGTNLALRTLQFL